MRAHLGMEYTHLGRTGLTVSRIALGALKAAAPENLRGPMP
jgi:aryl-alcohol dehydrogenase-like predicted oxidoreductase